MSASQGPESDGAVWLDPLAPPNPALPQILEHGQAWATARQAGGDIAETGCRVPSLLTDRGPGPSGEAPLGVDAYPGDFEVCLDVPAEELHERLRVLGRRLRRG